MWMLCFEHSPGLWFFDMFCFAFMFWWGLKLWSEDIMKLERPWQHNEGGLWLDGWERNNLSSRAVSCDVFPPSWHFGNILLWKLCQDALASAPCSLNSCVNYFRLPHRKSNYATDVKVLFIKICTLATRQMHNTSLQVRPSSVLASPAGTPGIFLVRAGSVEYVWPAVSHGTSSGGS